MEITRTVGPVIVMAETGDEETLELIAGATESALDLIKDYWGLPAPADCRMAVMTHWRRFFFQTAPWHWRVLLVLMYPVWALQVRSLWSISAGWTQRYGRRTAIGIKPPRLMEVSDKSISALMFNEEPVIEDKIRHVACHELTHACSAHLRLPAWLNEGIATSAVDRMLGKATIRSDSLSLIRKHTPKEAPPDYPRLRRTRGEVFAYHAVRGHWLVQYMQAEHPGFLREILSRRRDAREIDRRMAERLGIPAGALWRQVDDRIVGYFGPTDDAASGPAE